MTETGDLLDARLRAANAHTFERVETTLSQVALVRIDAGFPDATLLAGLEANGTPYVARIKNNNVLDRMRAPHLRRPPGRPPAEPHVWFHEMTYAAGTWSRPRRVVLVVLQQPDELLLRHFWLLTSIDAKTLDGKALLALYRQRGTANVEIVKRSDAGKFVVLPSVGSWNGRLPGSTDADGRQRTGNVSIETVSHFYAGHPPADGPKAL